MNIAEYIEQNVDDTDCYQTVLYHQFAKDVGLKDIRAVREWIESDLQELFKCRYITRCASGVIVSNLITELFFAENHVQIEFTHWIYQLRKNNPHCLSDILQQTRMNNYIVKGD